MRPDMYSKIGVQISESPLSEPRIAPVFFLYRKFMRGLLFFQSKLALYQHRRGKLRAVDSLDSLIAK